MTALDELQKLKRDVEDLKIELSDKQREIDLIDRKIKRIEESLKVDAPVKKKLNVTTARRTPDKPKQQQSTTPIRFVDEFNALANASGLTLKNLREEFVQKYSVRAFTCTNTDARMNEPIPPPIFADATNGDYWAVPVQGNTYAVMPSIKNYTYNHHSARAMGDVFNSNFEAGKTYSKIFVESPAGFECSGNVWKIKWKGKLKLEG